MRYFTAIWLIFATLYSKTRRYSQSRKKHRLLNWLIFVIDLISTKLAEIQKWTVQNSNIDVECGSCDQKVPEHRNKTQSTLWAILNRKGCYQTVYLGNTWGIRNRQVERLSQNAFWVLSQVIRLEKDVPVGRHRQRAWAMVELLRTSASTLVSALAAVLVLDHRHQSHWVRRPNRPK